MDNRSSIRGKIIREALQTRLTEVTELLDDLSPMPVSNYPNRDLEHKEELLRVLMVGLWPKIERETATHAEILKFFSHLFDLSQMALTKDWRFLDAWNNAYETIVKMKWSDEELNGNVITFMQYYAFILRTHVMTFDNQNDDVFSL